MNFIERFRSFTGLEKRTSIESPAVSLGSPGIWKWMDGGEPTVSGEQINDHTAMQIVAVYSCVRIIAESVASLPMKLYQRTATGKIEAVDSPLYALLTVSPNEEMTSFSFWETFAGSLALTGNAYSEIQRNGAGDATGLWPLNPRLTTPYRLPNGVLAYRTSDGMANGTYRIIASENVLHCPLLGDGVLGLSPIQQARQALGLSRAAEKFGARFFGNGARPGGILSQSSENDMSEEGIAQVRGAWHASHGASNQGKVAVLYGGWTYQSLGLSPDESQFLETRQFSREEVSSLFRVPVHMLADTSKLSNNTATQLSLSFITKCLRAYLSRIEAEVLRKLLPPVAGKLSPYFVQFDVREMLRGDFQQTLTALASGRQWGFYSINDCKAELGENPIGPEGDIYLYPLNMGNAANLLKPAEDIPVPDQNTLGSYRSSFHRLFRDGVGKLCHREKRDLAAVTSTFEALLSSIADMTLENTRSRNQQPDLEHDSTATVRTYLSKLTERAATWRTENADQIAVSELTKAIKALAFDTTRAAANHQVTKELESA